MHDKVEIELSGQMFRVDAAKQKKNQLTLAQLTRLTTITTDSHCDRIE